jgi:hypothetical protein
VQVALTWPKDAALCTSLNTELMRLADGLNRTVWVPQPQGAAFVLPGFGEFVAVDEVGTPSRWRAYPSRLDEDWISTYGTDLDGRLAPLGEVAGARFAGVPFVSVPPHQLEHLVRGTPPSPRAPGCSRSTWPCCPTVGSACCWPTAPRSSPGRASCTCCCARPAGPVEDLLLLAQPPAEVWNSTIDHARSLVDGLSTDLWLPTLGADVWSQSDGSLAADGPDGPTRRGAVSRLDGRRPRSRCRPRSR